MPRSARVRSSFAIGLAAVLCSTLVSASPASPAAGASFASSVKADDTFFPAFEYRSKVFDRLELAYNPTGEWDFPTVLAAGEHFEDPLGDYYLYTAAHDNPGGISLFYADDPSGPWTEHADNPLIGRTWDPYFDVSHVSSPHALWVESEQQLVLYFHGENHVTRWATSSDGVAFSYGGVAVTAAQAGADVTEVSYARVYEHAIPGRGNRFTMVFMDAVPGDGMGHRVRRIRLATSDDARTWQVVSEPLVSPHDATGHSVSGPAYFPWRGGHYIVYHGSSGNMFVTSVGQGFDRQDHVGILHRPGQTSPANGRSASPTFLTEGDTVHMFYEVGQRGDTTIAHATASLTDAGVPLFFDPPAPEDPLPVPTSRFSDIRPDNPHYDDVQTAGELAITNGCNRAGSRYCPDRQVTRAEMGTFLMRAIPLPSSARSTGFTDVPAASSHVPGIAAIDRAGVTVGCGGTWYCPSRSVTRAEMATFLMRSADLPPRSGTRYVDVTSSSSHAPAIETIARAGLTNGCSPSRFCPDRPVTRAEMASFLVRTFGLSG